MWWKWKRFEETFCSCERKRRIDKSSLGRKNKFMFRRKGKAAGAGFGDENTSKQASSEAASPKKIA